MYKFTNYLLQCRDFNKSPWATSNSPTLTQNETGYDGQANKAWTVSDTDAVNSAKIYQDVTILDDYAYHTGSIYFKKTVGAASFPGFQINCYGDNNADCCVTVDTDNGVLLDRTDGPGYPPIDSDISGAGNFWRVTVVTRNNGGNNKILRFGIFPAISGAPASGNWDSTETGSCVIDASQAELNTAIVGDFVESSTFIASLGSEELRPFYLMEIAFTGLTVYFTDCDILIATLDGNIYTPTRFKFNSIKYSMENIVNKVDIEIVNLDSAATTLLVDSDSQGSDVTLKLTALDSNYNPVGREVATLFVGELDKWSFDEEKIKLTATSKFIKWQQQTLSYHSASCRWKAFKSTECDYAGGETWCDRTYARCTFLNNSTNFGGFRWLPGLAGQDIYWGKKPLTKKEYPRPGDKKPVW